MKTKTKLSPGWEHYRTGINGVRKWLNMATKCADDPDMLHYGLLYRYRNELICVAIIVLACLGGYVEGM